MPRFFKVQSAKFKVQMWCRIRDGINTCGAMDPGLRRDDDIEKSQNKKLKNLSPRGLTTGPR